MTLLELAADVEKAAGDLRPLNREVALAIGWHRYSPSEIGKSNPGWIAPEDFIGETIGKDGRKRPILDSLHGTSIWREPRDYLGSLDAAITLIPESWPEFSLTSDAGGRFRCDLGMASDGGAYDFEDQMSMGRGETMALAVLSAALRAIYNTQIKASQS